MFAGHGLVHNGAQTVLINEFEPTTGYYKLFLVEQLMHPLAQDKGNGEQPTLQPLASA